jgi:hypothetical protein
MKKNHGGRTVVSRAELSCANGHHSELVPLHPPPLLMVQEHCKERAPPAPAGVQLSPAPYGDTKRRRPSVLWIRGLQ